MEAMEGEGRSEMEYTEIETTAECLDSSVIFHVVTDILGFVLFMHQQIPSILQDISLEFDGLQTEYKELEIVLAQAEVKASLRRQHAGRMKEVKQGIKRLEKVMKTVSGLRTALQLMISEIPDIQRVMLVLGTSPIRPQHVYEMCFSHGKIISIGAGDFAKSKAAEGLSRKAIRTLISKGAGSDSHAGPTKLFLLVKAPTSFNMPLHFLPKRDFRYSKKIVPFRLRFKCKAQFKETEGQIFVAQTADSISSKDCTPNDLIWFQCRHVVKGLVTKTSPTED
ncbi:Melanoma inhibitory activity protein [Actinidia chinensis var. chinensis]|uniref:Melanoma inhibitory activity protein n=1 Tax=Actinidia chinensis var. chinensis TaxID=1590841 RepID=A0A2R6QU21_ACTCC|nr:Melanoma inhibitory activity protein [Actinidia chinensis var. chinensis]